MSYLLQIGISKSWVLDYTVTFCPIVDHQRYIPTFLGVNMSKFYALIDFGG